MNAVRKWRTSLWIGGALLCVVASAGRPLAVRGADAKTTPPTPAALAARVKEIFRQRCFDCHGGTSTQAGVAILDHAKLITLQALVPGKPDESKIYRSVIEPNEAARMPMDAPPLSSQEIDAIRQYILAGAPVFPADVVAPAETSKDAGLRDVTGVDYVLKQILRHAQSLAPADRANVRYFSCNHLLARGATRAELDLQRAALAKAINHLSRQPLLVRPEAVDGETASIFAVDIRKLGWDKRPFRTTQAGQETASPFNLFDLVLLEYPYGILFEDSTTFDALLTDFVAPAGLVRPIPYLRSDWFCSVATQPPLYHDLLQLPVDLGTLEKELGIDSEANVRERRVQRAGMAVSGVSRNNRAVERHEGPRGMYWKSVDYGTSQGRENIFTDPIRLEGTGGEMIFRLPNGMHAYYVATGKGERLDFAPTSIVTDKFAEDKTVRNGLACMRCHDQGVKSFTDDVRPAVERLPGSSGIDKRETLALYVPQAEMDALLDQDRSRFLAAMEKVLGRPQGDEPLIQVSQRFLDSPLQLPTAAGELGLAQADDLRAVFRQPTFTALGLIPLTNCGVVRRDMWEDYYDQIVRGMGLGVPVVPVDGVSRRDYRPIGSSMKATLASTKPNNTFAPGDELAFVVTNQGERPLFVELLGTGTRGEMVSLIAAGTKVAPGASVRFPEKGTLRVQPSLGKETVTLFASEAEFPAAQILKGTNVGDRAVHNFYAAKLEQGRLRVEFDAFKVLKRTLEIETR